MSTLFQPSFRTFKSIRDSIFSSKLLKFRCEVNIAYKNFFDCLHWSRTDYTHFVSLPLPMAQIASLKEWYDDSSPTLHGNR